MDVLEKLLAHSPVEPEYERFRAVTIKFYEKFYGELLPELGPEGADKRAREKTKPWLDYLVSSYASRPSAETLENAKLD